MNSQLDSQPGQTRQERVGKYLCTFESTNNRVADNTSLPKTSKIPDQPSGYSAADMKAFTDWKLRAMTLVKKEGAEGSALPKTGAVEVPAPAVPQEPVTELPVKAPPVKEGPVKAPPVKEPPVKQPPAKEPPVKEPPAKEGPAKDRTPLAPSAEDTGGINLRAAETTAKNTADKPEASPVTKENVFRIVDKAVATLKDGRQDFEVELKPDFLGRVNIKLTMEDGKMKMQIKTEDMAVKGLFTDQIPALHNALRDKGIVMSNIDVVYEEPSFSGSEQRQPNQQNSPDTSRKAPGGGFERLAGNAQYDAPAALQGLLFGNSTVEFRA